MPTDQDLRYAIRVQDAALKELQRNIRALNKDLAASEKLGGGGRVAGDFDKANRSAKGAASSTVLFGTSLKNAFKFGAAASVGATVLNESASFLRQSSRDAREAERSSARLEAQLDALGLATRSNTDAVIEATRAQALWAGVTDDELVSDSLVNLLRTTRDVTRAIELNALALDISAGKNISLEQASRLVARVYAGNTSALSRYAIVIDKAASSTEALTILQERFAGQAEKAGRTADAAFARTSLRVEELRERIGGRLNRAVADHITLTERLVGAAGDIDRAIDDKVPDWVSTDPVTDWIGRFNARTRAAALGINDDAGPLFHDVIVSGRDAAEQTAAAWDLAGKRIERRLRASLVGRLDDVRDKALDTFDAETDALISAHDRVSESLVREFDQATDEMVERMRVAVKVGDRQFTIGQGQMTPAERELAALDKIERKRNVAREGHDAREDLSQAMLIGDPAQIQEAKRRLEDVEHERKKIRLEGRAKTEREAANKALEAEEESLRDSRDVLGRDLAERRRLQRDDLSGRRDALRRNLEAELDAHEQALRKGKTLAAEGQEKILAVLRKYGADYRGVGAELGGKFLSGFTGAIDKGGPGGRGYIPLAIVLDPARGETTGQSGRRGGARGGIVGPTLGKAGPTDTVPAWLTPGEMILTGRDQAKLARLLGTSSTGAGLLANIRMGFADGGVVDEDLHRRLLESLSRTIGVDVVKRAKLRQSFASTSLLTGKGMTDAQRRMLSPIHLQSKLKNAVGDRYADLDRETKLRLLGNLAQRQAHVFRSGLVEKGATGLLLGSNFRDPGSGRLGGGGGDSFTIGDLNFNGGGPRDLDVRDLAQKIRSQLIRHERRNAQRNRGRNAKSRVV